MDMPEVTKCFGAIPPKHATYMISLFGLSSGGAGVAGIILYGLIEKAIMNYLYGNSSEKMDEGVRKLVLLTIGLTSLLLVIANLLLFLGTTASSNATLSAGVFVILMMCMLLIIEAIALPTACFFHKNFCVIKKLSNNFVVIGGLVITFFLEIWLYFMVVANTYAEQI